MSFVERIVEVLTDLCIGRDARAVRIIQDLIAQDWSNESHVVMTKDIGINSSTNL